MELVTAVKKKNCIAIEELVAKKGIPFDKSWSDYKALNIAIVRRRKRVAKFLIDNYCRVNKIPTIGEKPSNTPLHNAVNQKDYQMVNKLLNKNASVTAINQEGNSPLHLAFYLGYEKIIDRILDFIQQTDTLVNIKNNYGLTHFHIACTRSNVNVVLSYINTTASSLSDSVNKNSQSYYAGYTALQFAMQSKSPLILKHVLEQSESLLPNNVESLMKLAQQDLDCMSVKAYLLSDSAQANRMIAMSQFHIACMQQNHDLIQTFLECGVPVNDPINEEAASCPLYTPLHLAVEANCKESIQLLLEYGANPDLQNIKLMTPLHLGLYNDNQEILNLLYAQAKKKEEREDLTDCYGLRYFHIAISRNDFEFVFKFLGEEGQDMNASVLPNSPNFSGYTPLHFAVRYGHLEMAKLLIKNGADVNACDATQDGTPLHIAFFIGHTQLISLLLNHQPRVDYLRPCDKKTILHLLVQKLINTDERNNSQLILYVKQLVLDCKIDVNAQDSDGYTALHYACTKISVGASCAQILIECGADINIVNARSMTPFETSFSDDYCDNPADYLLLYNHIQKLTALGFPVNEKNYDCCTKLLMDRKRFLKGMVLRNKSLQRKQEKRAAELKRMKRIKLWPDISVFDFVIKNSLGLRALGSNAHVNSNIKIKCFKKEFSQFGYFVDLQWRRLQSLYSNKIKRNTTKN